MSVGVGTRTEIGWRSIGVDCCRKRNKPWRACSALRSALAGAPFWLYAGGVVPCPEPRGLKARRLVFRQVPTPRLPGPPLGIGCRKPNRKTPTMTIETCEAYGVTDTFSDALARIERLGSCRRLVFAVSHPHESERVIVAKVIVPAELMHELAQMIAADAIDPATAFARLPVDAVAH
jgi:hypothetical protein